VDNRENVPWYYLVRPSFSCLSRHDGNQAGESLPALSFSLSPSSQSLHMLTLVSLGRGNNRIQLWLAFLSWFAGWWSG
jgi:hypothetical protein